VSEGLLNQVSEPIYGPLEEGDPERIGGFAILGRLGCGGMGTVYLGVTRGGRVVAVKQVLPALAGSKCFEREIRSLHRLPAGIAPRVHAHDFTAERPWFATDYVPGCTVGQVVERYGPLPVESLWRLLHVMAAHLRVVHKAKIIHRDLTPANVILTVDGARLVDFGIARLAEQVNSTVTSGLAGTHGFLAPEQRAGGEISAKVDVYALGALVCYAASGRWPGEVPDLEPVRAVDRELAAIVERCLARTPDVRRDAKKLAGETASRVSASTSPWPEPVMQRIAELGAFADSRPKPPQPPEPPPPPPPPSKWRAAMLASSITTVLVASAGVFVLLMPNRSPSADPPGPVPTHKTSISTTTTPPQPSPTLPTPPAPSAATTPPSLTTTAIEPSASSTIDPRSDYAIENSGTGQCLGQAYPLAQAGVTMCTSLAPTDGWNYYSTQANGTFELIDKYTGQCLGEKSTTGGLAVTATCAGMPGQLWEIGYSNSYGLSFVNTESGQCLMDSDVYGYGTIELDSCNQQRDQLWYNDGTL
jgi:eukaryotic-like serine/threonine-protein kinase